MHKPHLRYKLQTPRERTSTIHLISLEKVLKATVLFVVGFKMLSLLGRDVHEWAADLVTRHGIDIANRYVHSALERLVGVGDPQLTEFGVAAFVYSAVLYVEGIGLWLQKRWAEYLTAIGTALFIPVEIYELFERFTWVRVAALAINVFIVWYLVTRLRDEKGEIHGHASGTIKGVRIKICGITNYDDALLAVKYGATDLGFNFYEKSSRYVTPGNARAIVDAVPATLGKIGVFVNESGDAITRIAAEAGLSAIQLHGDEDAVFIRETRERTGLSVIKALRVGPEFNSFQIPSFGADAILFDTYSAEERGGSGTTFDWSIARKAAADGYLIYLAGGLTPDNVSEAINEVRPFGVDVCSGVESIPGKKDPKKLKAFMAAVKEAL